jgi:hypothetical protein
MIGDGSRSRTVLAEVEVVATNYDRERSNAFDSPKLGRKIQT